MSLGSLASDHAIGFAGRAERTYSLERLNIEAQAALSIFGVTCFSANLVSSPGRAFKPGILFGHRWREWSRRYQARGFAAHDPALRMLREKTRPFTWSEASASFKSVEGERVVRACLDYTGCGEGLVIPVRESDGSLLTAAFSGPQLELDADARAAMHLIGLYYVTRGREISLGLQLDPRCPLTRRQLECLTWVRRGKTDKEMAAIMRISPRTAHHHVEGAKLRLEVSKRGQAADIAWRSGWLD